MNIPKDTMGVFHRNGTKVQFNPVERAALIKKFREFYTRRIWDVRGFTYEGTQHTGSSTYGRDDIDAFIASGGTDGFNPYFRHLLGGHKRDGKACGQGEFGGNECVAYDEFGCTDQTSLHEDMHCGIGNGTPSQLGIGLGHCHELSRDGTWSIMGDYDFLMGAGYGEGLPTAMMYLLAEFAELNILTKSQQVLIAPAEMEGLHENEFKFVQIRVQGHNPFWLSTYQPYPYPHGVASRDALYIHEFFAKIPPHITDNAPNSTLLHKVLHPGDAYVLPNGTTVQYLDMYEGIARVNVVFDAGDTIEPVAQILTLPIDGSPPPSGWYYAPVSSGHGVLVHNNNGKGAIYWYTGNNTRDGYPRYYWAQGALDEELSLLTTVGGTPSDPSSAVTQMVGKCRFTGSTFTFVLEGIRGGIEMIPVISAQEHGVYYYPPRDGEGISAHYYIDYLGTKKCAVGFWTYGAPQIGTPNTTQRWYVGDGTWNDTLGQYDLNFVEVVGRFHTARLTEAPAGTGRLIRGDVDHVSFGFKINGRDETYPMTRLV